jgi:hypothetical protein
LRPTLIFCAAALILLCASPCQEGAPTGSKTETLEWILV